MKTPSALFLLCAGLCLPGASASAAPAIRPPNFVLIMADDLGYGDLSCYGSERARTPHLDALAREGLRFTDYHSNGCVCSPTRAALLTGRYQQRSGVDEVVFADPKLGYRENYGLQPGEITFAHLLRAAGYRTAIFGKWHLGYARKFNPVHHGFDEFRGYVSGNVDYQSHVDGAGFADWWHGAELEPERGYTTHLITRHAVRFLEEQKDRPFCLYVAQEAVHSPYQGPGDGPLRQAGEKGREKYPAGHIARAYREMVEEMDRSVGEIVATLRRLGLERDTFVFFCSDNGATKEGSNGRLRGFKASLWEGGHRVPAIAWWPGKIAPGTAGETALAMDVLPTFLDLAGATPPKGHLLDGVSLAALLREAKPLPARQLFWAYNQQGAVREGPWKLVVTASASPPALFHLGEDPAEKNDLAARHPERVAALTAAFAAWKKSVGGGVHPPMIHPSPTAR